MKKTGYFKEAFFGPDTIEGWHLNQLASKAAALTSLEPSKKGTKGGFVVTGSVGGSGSEGFEELMKAAAEFNANVPVTGCEQSTEKDKVSARAGARPEFLLCGRACCGLGCKTILVCVRGLLAAPPPPARW